MVVFCSYFCVIWVLFFLDSLFSVSFSAIASSHNALRTDDESTRSMLPSSNTTKNDHWMSTVPMAPLDGILGLTETFNADNHSCKVNLVVGAYRDKKTQPLVLSSVRKAKEIVLASNANKEYLPIIGSKPFIDLSLKFAYGTDSIPLQENRILGFQTLSGTGALRLAGDFFRKFLGKSIYLPNPTWAYHKNIMEAAYLELKEYRYYNPTKRTLDLEGLLQDIKTAPDNSLFLFHACAHNPTGLDPSKEQWKQISAALKEKDHNVLFDNAYQGFASGDIDKDAWAIRYFANQGHLLWLAQSYSKNFGLYGERVGCLSVITQTKEQRKNVKSQMRVIILSTYLNPSIHGAQIVETILSDNTLYKEWKEESRKMVERIQQMRILLKTHLEKVTTSKRISEWKHITDQIGMFCLTGLTVPEAEELTAKYHIYLTKTGRICMAGVTKKNVQYIAQSIAAVLH